VVFGDVKMILHIASDNTKLIIYPFIEFVNQNFNKNEHFFILCSKDKDIKKFENAITKDIFIQTDFFIQQMKKADKIILHGIWYDKLCEIILNHNLFDKIYWNLWGGDFYFYEKESNIKKICIHKIKYCITDTLGDFEFLQKHYKNKAKLFKSFMYPSNLYKTLPLNEIQKKDKIYIQIGNSADSTNNHVEIFEKIKYYKNIKVFVPLVYGNMDYANEIVKKGRELFQDFNPIFKKMSFQTYINYLAMVDIAFFNHRRQQALGNIITLLGFGKKVYLRSDVVTWDMFQNMGIEVFDVRKKIDLSMSFNKEKNINIIKNYYSKEKLIENLKEIFSY